MFCRLFMTEKAFNGTKHEGSLCMLTSQTMVATVRSIYNSLLTFLHFYRESITQITWIYIKWILFLVFRVMLIHQMNGLLANKRLKCKYCIVRKTFRFPFKTLVNKDYELPSAPSIPLLPVCFTTNLVFTLKNNRCVVHLTGDPVYWKKTKIVSFHKITVTLPLSFFKK